MMSSMEIKPISEDNLRFFLSSIENISIDQFSAVLSDFYVYKNKSPKTFYYSRDIKTLKINFTKEEPLEYVKKVELAKNGFLIVGFYKKDSKLKYYRKIAIVKLTELFKEASQEVSCGSDDIFFKQSHLNIEFIPQKGLFLAYYSGEDELINDNSQAINIIYSFVKNNIMENK